MARTTKQTTQETAEKRIAKRAEEYITANKLSRDTVINIRRLLRKTTNNDNKQIDGYLKLITMCKPKTYTIKLNPITTKNDSQNEVIKEILQKAKLTNVSLIIEKEYTEGPPASEILMKTLQTLIEQNENIFFRKISLAPNIWVKSGISTDAAQGLSHKTVLETAKQVIKKLITDARSFETQIDFSMSDNYQFDTYQIDDHMSSLFYSTYSSKEPKWTHEHLVDSGYIILNRWAFASKLHVSRFQNPHITRTNIFETSPITRPNKILFNFEKAAKKENEGPGTKQFKSRLEQVTKFPVTSLQPFLTLVKNNQNYFDMNDSMQSTFFNTFCPTLEHIINGNLTIVKILEKNEIIQKQLLRNSYTIHRHITYDFNSCQLTKYLITQELLIFEQESIKDLLQIVEKMLHTNHQQSLLLKRKESLRINQINFILKHFQNAITSDFQEFLKHFKPENNFIDLYCYDKTNVHQKGFDKRIVKFLKYITDNKQNSYIAAQIINEICKKDNIDYRIKRMSCIFKTPIDKWDNKLKNILVGTELTHEEENTLIAILIQQGTEKLKHLNKKLTTQIIENHIHRTSY